MSQGAAKRLRRRFSINFRDVGKIGRPKYPKARTGESAMRRQARWAENKRKNLIK